MGVPSLLWEGVFYSGDQGLIKTDCSTLAGEVIYSGLSASDLAGTKKEN